MRSENASVRGGKAKSLVVKNAEGVWFFLSLFGDHRSGR